MREIKFRGRWNGKWVYGGIENRHNGEILVGGNGVWHVVDPESVGQYTGIKDKNGKEIYEGDIARFSSIGNLPERYGDVFFSRGAFRARWFKRPTGKPSDDAGILQTYVDTVEVIGSIYENPDLCPTS